MRSTSPSLFRALTNALARAPRNLSGVDDSRGWFHLWSGGSGEMNQGDWQADRQLPPNQALAFFAVYACVTQIAGDIGKLCLRLMEKDTDRIWSETENPSYSPVLRKPNHFQTQQQFVESWQLSKQTRGNTYVLLERDGSSKVRAQYVLNPDRVTPLIADSGDVYYELHTDNLSRIPFASVTVPASEIIHDRFNCLFHPLVGVTPLYACGLAASQGINMQKNSAKFFGNMSRPSGVLLGPSKITDETAARLKRDWEGNFGQGKIGKVAVLGDGLKYEPMAVTPKDAEIVDQLKLSATQVCAVYGVPGWKIGIEPMPAGQKVEDLNQIYYSDCLQTLVKAVQSLQDQALGLPAGKLCTMFDLDELLLMDSKTRSEVEGNLQRFGISKPNESRRKFNLPPVKGGDTPYLQQQNFSLAALDKRDKLDDPFGTTPAPTPAPAPAPAPSAEEVGERAAALLLQRLQPQLERWVETLLQPVRAEHERQREEAERREREAQEDAALLAAFKNASDDAIAQAAAR